MIPVVHLGFRCEQMLVHEEEREAKDVEILSLQEQLIALEGQRVSCSSPSEVVGGRRDRILVHKKWLSTLLEQRPWEKAMVEKGRPDQWIHLQKRALISCGRTGYPH